MIVKLVIIVLVLLTLYQSISKIIKSTAFDEKYISIDSSLIYSTMSTFPNNITYVYSKKSLASKGNGFQVILSNQEIITNAITETMDSTHLSGKKFRFVSLNDSKHYQCIFGKANLTKNKRYEGNSYFARYVYDYDSPILIQTRDKNIVKSKINTFQFTQSSN
ncbi:MAG: hypothetical protein GWP09_01245 [Nitrospiraceae bacterium]|nr:hypothetical protein [Nitrospiraceae bacterium]